MKQKNEQVFGQRDPLLIFCSVTQVTEKMSACNREIHLLFMDLKEAYDSVPLSKLWEELEHTNLTINLIMSVKELYRNYHIKVKDGTKIFGGFKIVQDIPRTSIE